MLLRKNSQKIMRIGKRIEELLEEHGWSQNMLAEKLGCRQSTISMWITGRQEPGRSLRRKLCAVFGISEAELFASPPVSEKRAEYLPVRTVPLLAWQDLNKLIGEKEPSSSQYIHTVRRERNLFAVTVEDDTMLPEFYPGDILIAHPVQTPPANSYVLVFDDHSGGAMLRQYKKYGPKAVLHPLNPRYGDTPFFSSHHTVLGKVVEKRKTY